MENGKYSDEESREMLKETEMIEITVSRVADKVVMQFEKELRWIAWDPVLATKISDALRDKAIEILESDVE